MSAQRPAPNRTGHVGLGIVLVGLGTAGVIQFWAAFGIVARGLFPAWLVGGGMVMMGAGLRAGRADRMVYRLLATAGVAVLTMAAASGVEIDLARDWAFWEVSGYLALGFASGIVGGMLGLGGGVVHLSGMTLLFGFPFAFARGATLINNVFINAAAAAHYGRQQLISRKVVAVLLPASLVGVVVGSWFQSGLDESSMRRIFSVFVILITVAIVIDTFTSPARDPVVARPPPALVRHGLTGILAGVLSGILGISGGIVAVPGQTLLSSVPLRNAIANSSITTSIGSALGVLLTFLPGSQPTLGVSEMVTIAILFVPGNLVGGHLGARFMGRLPVLTVRLLFVAGLLAITLRSVLLQ